MTFTVEVDYFGNGTWKTYEMFTLDTEDVYRPDVFPDGFSAHWMRVTADRDCRAIARLIYH